MTTLLNTLSGLWTLIRYLPTALALIATIREALGSEAVQAVIKAVKELVGKTDTTAENTGTVPANTEPEKQGRLQQLLNRLRIAAVMTDGEVAHMHTAHNMKPYQEDTKQWT